MFRTPSHTTGIPRPDPGYVHALDGLNIYPAIVVFPIHWRGAKWLKWQVTRGGPDLVSRVLEKRETPTEAFPRPDSDGTGLVNWERSVKERDDILQELLFTEPRMFHGPASLPGQRR